MKIIQKDWDELKELEESLWHSETRFDLEYMNKILAPDFVEFGRSGRIYKREDTLAVPKEESLKESELQNFLIRQIDTETFLVTYVSRVMFEELEVGNRSSLWSKTPEGWKLRFHQGTAVGK